MTDLLRAQGLAVRLGGKSILDGLSLDIAPGRLTCIVGPNGAGKSTLMACLAGLRKPDAGEVRLGETPVLSMAHRARARRIGFLPQTPEIAWPLEVEALVALGRSPHAGIGLPGEADRAAIAEAMRRTEVEAFAGRPVNTLSGGERGRVLIARALAGEPEWLLADEPLTGLDPGHQLDACRLFRALAHEEGRGVVVTLHDLSVALREADHVVVVVGGAILAEGPPEEALTAEVLGQAYGVDARVSQGAEGPVLELVGRRK